MLCTYRGVEDPLIEGPTHPKVSRTRRHAVYLSGWRTAAASRYPPYVFRGHSVALCTYRGVEDPKIEGPTHPRVSRTRRHAVCLSG